MNSNVIPQVPNNAAYRMVLLLQAIKDKETSFAAIAREYKNEIKNLYDELDRLRMDILTGQISLLDVMQAPETEERKEHA